MDSYIFYSALENEDASRVSTTVFTISFLPHTQESLFGSVCVPLCCLHVCMLGGMSDLSDSHISL